MKNQLITMEQLQGLGLSKQSREILLARQSAKISTHSEPTLEKFAKTILGESYYRMNLKNGSEESVRIATRDLVEAFKTTFQNWTAEEIRLACKMGALGELGTEERMVSSRTLSWRPPWKMTAI